MSKAPDPKVEDVLSSVRRLVSSELPRKPRPDVPEGDGALVLTKAHRIESAQPESAKAPPNLGSTDPSRSLEDRIAELEAAVGGQDDEFEPDGSEDQAQHRPDRIVYTPTSSEADVTSRVAQRLSQIALIETGPAIEDTPEEADIKDTPEEAATFRHKTEQVAEAPMAEDVPTVPRPRSEVAAFSDPDDMAANIDARIVSGRPTTEPLQLVDPNKINEPMVKGWQTETPSDDRAPEAADFDAALTAAVKASIESSDAKTTPDANKDENPVIGDILDAREFSTPHFNLDTADPEITAGEMLAETHTKRDTGKGTLESVVAAMTGEDVTTDEKAVEDTSSADEAPTPVATEEAVSDEVEVPVEETETAADQNDVPTVEPEETTDQAEAAAAALDALGDEDAMRLLVARMMRDELQGDLGERITRNVRKLVRREIKQALSSQKLT